MSLLARKIYDNTPSDFVNVLLCGILISFGANILTAVITQSANPGFISSGILFIIGACSGVLYSITRNKVQESVNYLLHQNPSRQSIEDEKNEQCSEHKIGLILFPTIFIFCIVVASISIYKQLSKDKPQSKLAEDISCSSIWPFVDAMDSISYPQGKISLDQMIGNMISRMENDSLEKINIIGKYDKRELRRDSKRYFGANANLALARAIYVKKTLLHNIEKLKMFESRIMTMVSAAEHIGNTVSADSLSRDRCVEVYSYWKIGCAK